MTDLSKIQIDMQVIGNKRSAFLDLDERQDIKMTLDQTNAYVYGLRDMEEIINYSIQEANITAQNFGDTILSYYIWQIDENGEITAPIVDVVRDIILDIVEQYQPRDFEDMVTAVYSHNTFGFSNRDPSDLYGDLILQYTDLYPWVE